MAVLKYKLYTLALIFFSGCAFSTSLNTIILNNEVVGCFSLKNEKLDVSVEPVTLAVTIGSGGNGLDCPCKSALMKYSVYQELETGNSDLLSGYFSVLNKESVVLPIAVQRQLIFPDSPIRISISCSSTF